MHTCPATPAPPMHRATALEIVSHPERHAHRPLRFRLAWMALKAERGQTICQHKLREAQRAAGLV